uniref:superoxide dismutase n=1 Tax=viral metagenome TaxID=1070528 RepID=A0A6C0BA70_9ZZZZ
MVKKNTTKKNATRINKSKSVSYKPVDFSYLLGRVKGIDDKLMKIHFKLYEGLVGATNGALKFIQDPKNVKNMVQYSAVQKELSLFYNGMRLHELYFGVMCGENMDHMDPGLIKEINQYFGSFSSWKSNFIATGTIPGVGFVALCRDRNSGLLFNTWINEFNIGEIIGADIILVMDMWEHAYIAEFGLDLLKYSNTFLTNVNWSVVSKLYKDSVNNKNSLILQKSTD